MLHRKGPSDQSGNEVPAIVYEVLRSPGKPLDAETLAFMEPRFKHDFSTIRVHTDTIAAESALLLGAAAYTLGHNLVFGSGQFAPGSSSGRKLIAHELTHAIQQGNAEFRTAGPLRVAPAQSQEEGVAEAVSSQIESEESASLRKSGNPSEVGQLQRKRAIEWQQGPQSYAPAEPGSEVVSSVLVSANRRVENDLLSIAEAFLANKDLRWFFTYAHARITNQINASIGQFQRPNALLAFNLEFSRKYIAAVAEASSLPWQAAFAGCFALDWARPLWVQAAKAELCGAAMATLHIGIDIREALDTIGCLPPIDFAAVLPFINTARRDAIVMLRGQFIGNAENTLVDVFENVFPYEGTLRALVYESICNVQPAEDGTSQ